MEQNLSQRLADLRKENKLSQEALAEKMGLSRQAISKWERGESAPDTENLIMLSGIYGITLDELLHGKETKETAEEPIEKPIEETEPKEEAAEISAAEIPCEKEKERENAEPKKEEINAEKEVKNPASFENIEEKILPKEKKKRRKKEKPPRLCRDAYKVFLKIPVIIIVPLIFVIVGVLKGVWHPTWLINLFVPIYYIFCFALAARSKKSLLLRMPVFLITVAAFLTIGILTGKWHPAWMVFFFDLLYYWIAFSLKNPKKE